MSIKWFFKNIYTQRKALWQARPWDYEGIYYYLYHQVDAMEKSQREYGIHLHKEKYCDRMRVVCLILERLIRDEYIIERYSFVKNPKKKDEVFDFDIVPKYDFFTKGAEWKQKQIDQDYLFKMLNKHINSWWD